MNVEKKADAGAVLVYMVGALMVTGGGIVDVGAAMVGLAAVSATMWAHDQTKLRSDRVHRIAGAAVVVAFVAWLALPWLLWWAR